MGFNGQNFIVFNVPTVGRKLINGAFVTLFSNCALTTKKTIQLFISMIDTSLVA